MDLALITLSGLCAIKPNQTKPNQGHYSKCRKGPSLFMICEKPMLLFQRDFAVGHVYNLSNKIVSECMDEGIKEGRKYNVLKERKRKKGH